MQWELQSNNNNKSSLSDKQTNEWDEIVWLDDFISSTTLLMQPCNVYLYI